MSHICKTCNRNYSSYQSLYNHNKKFHSKVEEPVKLLCQYCKKPSSRKDNLHRHEKNCKHNKSNEYIELKKEINNLKEQLNNKTEIKKQTNNINNGNIITINNFSKDNTDYISEDFIKRMFKHFLCEDEHKLAIPKLIENLKFNPNHPENNNVRITNMRSDVGFKYNDEKWLTVDKEELINEMFKIGANLFLKFYKEKNGLLSEDMKSCYQEFKSACYSNADLTDEIKERIQKIAYIYTKNIDLDK
jgi:hypothetical protein